MIRSVVLLAGLLGIPLFSTFAQAAATSVEPSELTKRPELIGREVSVDDRVALFLFHQGATSMKLP